jgi:hypothetical protein
MREDNMGKLCGMNGGGEKCIQNFEETAWRT